MRAYARKVVTNPLFSGSVIMIFGSNMANFFAYLYHFVIGRLLDASEYGEVGAILSLLGLLSVLISFFGLVIVKFVSSAEEGDLGAVFTLFNQLISKVGLFGAVILLVLSPLLSTFLHIELGTMLLVGPVFFASSQAFVYRAFLQGLLKFPQLVVSTNFEIILRLAIGAVLILFGFSVFGVFAGYLLAVILNFFLLKLFFKSIKIGKAKKKVFNKLKPVLNYALPIFVASFFSYAIISVDVLLVKHYFVSEQSGVYVVLSTLGRITFFAVAPISAVMFPIIAKRKSGKLNYKSIFRLSMALSLSMVALIVLVYQFLPNIVVGVLYGFGRYPQVYTVLPLTSVFVGLYALASQIVNYNFSLGHTKIAVLLPLTLLSQIIGIILFHDSLLSVIIVSIVTTGSLLVVLLGRLIYDKEI